MAFDAGSIVAKLQADISGFQSGMQKAQEQTSNFGESFKKGAHIAAGALAAVGVGLTVLAVKSTDFAVNYLKDATAMSRVTGESVTETSRLMYVFKRMGMEAEETSKIFGIFAKKIVAARDNAEDANDAFKKIGVSIKDAQGNTKGFEALLFEVSDKFKAIPNGIEKTNLAMQMFGRSGADMIKVLNLGSDGIKALMEQADKLGITLTTDNIGKVKEYIESQKKLKDSTDSLQMAVGTTTAPVLADFNNKIAEITQKLLTTDGPLKDFATNVIAFGGPVATGAGGLIELGANISSLSPKMLAAGGAMVAITAIIAALVISYQQLQAEAKKTQEQGKASMDAANTDQQTRLNAQKSMLDQGLIDQQTYNQNVEQINAAHADRVKVAQEMQNATWYSVFWNGLLEGINGFGNFMQQMGQKFGEWQDNTRKGMENWIIQFIGGLGRGFMMGVNAVIGFVGNIVSWIGSIPGKIGAVLGGVWNAITSPFRAAFEWIKSKVNEVVGALANLNPFQRHSPSLFDLISKGNEAIIKNYSNMFDRISDLRDINASNLATGIVGAGGNATNNVDTKIFGNINIGSQSEANDFIARLSRNQEIADKGLAV